MCGVVIDYGETDEWSGLTIDSPETDRQSGIAHGLVPMCSGSTTGRAHHYVLGVGPLDESTLECAYGDALVTYGSTPGTDECVGDDPEIAALSQAMRDAEDVNVGPF